MVKIALGIEYDGRQFHGWQLQPGLRTVQGVLEKALSQIAAEPIRVHCAGRTDTGVHACNQVVHFESKQARHVRAWSFGVNSHLPKDVSVRWVKFVDDDFHARFSALSRSYRYLLFNNPNRPALYHGQLTWQYRPLNHERMQQAGQHLVGQHDFTSFRAIACQSKSPVREVKRLQIDRKGDLIILDIEANAFLHHMVRNIVGVLISIGLEKQDVDWTRDLLAVRDRTLGADTAPPNGLYLTSVCYPSKYPLPTAPVLPRLIAY